MNKKIILLIIILSILFINAVLIKAGNTKEINSEKNSIIIEKGKNISIGEEQILYNELWEKYNPLEIKDKSKSEILIQIAIINNTEKCGINCNSLLKLYMPNDGVLIEDIRFYTIIKENKIEQPIRNYKFYIKDKNKDKWKNYELGEKIIAGNYDLRIEGEKKSSRTVDWQIKTNGIWITELAMWVNLTSPENDYMPTTTSPDFSCSANVTGGANISSISFWNNATGIFKTAWVSYGTRGNNWSYDQTNDSIVGSQWTQNNAGIGSYVGEDTERMELNVTGLNSEQSGRAQVLSNKFVNVSQIDNMTIYLRLGGENGVTGTGTGYNYFGNLNVFGNDVFSIGCSATSPCLIYDTSVWTIIKNITAGNNRFDIFNDGVLDEQIIAINNEINITAFGYAGNTAGHTGAIARADIYYMNYAGENTFASPNVTTTREETVVDGTIWTCSANDTDGMMAWASENRTIIIKTPPIINILQPTGTISSINVSFNATIIGSSLDYCFYNVTRGASLEVINTKINCSNFTGQLTISGDATYSFNVWANDTFGNSNISRSSFIVSGSGYIAPPIIINSPGGGEGGEPPEEISKEFSILNTNLGNKIDLQLAKDSKKPRERTIVLINREKKEVTVELSCDQTNVNKSSREINVCVYVGFKNKTLILSPNENNPTETTFYLFTPDYSDFGDEYYFNIIAKQKDSPYFSKLSVSSQVSRLVTIFYKSSYWSDFPFKDSPIDFENDKSTYSVFLFSLPIAMIFLIGSIAIFQKADALFTGFIIGFSLFILIIWLMSLII